MKILSYRISQFLALAHGKNRAAPTIKESVSSRPGRGRFNRIRQEDSGQSIVEIALLLPVLLGVLTGIFSLGMALANLETLTQAVDTGARYLQTLQPSNGQIGTTDPCADTYAAMKLSLGTNLSPLSSLSITYTLNGHSFSSNSCSGAQLYLIAGSAVTVSATYPCNISVYGYNPFGSSCVLPATTTEYEY